MAHKHRIPDRLFMGAPSDPVWDVTDSLLHRFMPAFIGNQFAYDSKLDRWVYGLLTRKYSAPGIYEIGIVSGDDKNYMISPTCEVTYVVE